MTEHSGARALPNGFDPQQNQSEFYAPISSRCGDTFARSGIRLALGSQTYPPGPFHFEDASGRVGVGMGSGRVGVGMGYSPAPVYQLTLGFGGDVPLGVAPKFTQPSPWRRGAIY